MTHRDHRGLDTSQLPAAEKQNLLHELRIKRAQLNDALALALGLSLDATTNSLPTSSQRPRRHVHLLATTILRRTHPVLPIADSTVPPEPSTREPSAERSTLPSHHQDHSDQRHLTVPRSVTKTDTRPYFFRDNIEQPVYQLRDPALRNAPATPPALIALGQPQISKASI